MKKWNEISPFTGSSIGEDAPTNSAGSGSVAGLGVGPMGEPGVKKKKKRQSLIDARSKAYRQHRERLEASRLKRLESRNKRDKFTESIVAEMTYGGGSTGAMRPTSDMSNIYSAKSSSGYLKARTRNSLIFKTSIVPTRFFITLVNLLYNLYSLQTCMRVALQMKNLYGIVHTQMKILQNIYLTYLKLDA